MANRFCTNCGAQLVEGAAFCTSCGAPAAAGTPAEPAVEPPPAEVPPLASPPPVEPPPPVAAPAPVTEPPPFAAPPPVEGPFPAAGPAAAGPAGASRKTLIGIAIVLVLAVVIAFFVQRSEREFQRKRRAGQTSLSTSGSPTRPVAAGSYGSLDSRGAAGNDGWVRSQIVGRWTETRDCNNPIQFRADGTTSSGRWTFGGGRLSMIESDWTAVVELVSIGTQEMVLANTATRRQMTWRRC